MNTPLSQAVKNSDGTYTVRVFHTPERSSDVAFPYTPEGPQLALEYANFKNAQRVSGPLSPATQAVVADLKAMSSNDLHEQLMEKANLDESKANTERLLAAEEIAEDIKKTQSEKTSVPAPPAVVPESKPEVTKAPVPTEVKVPEEQIKAEE